MYIHKIYYLFLNSHNLNIKHILHLIFLAVQICFPCKTNQLWTNNLKTFGTTFINFFSTAFTFLPVAKLVRLDTLKTCVSTAIVFF